MFKLYNNIFDHSNNSTCNIIHNYYCYAGVPGSLACSYSREVTLHPAACKESVKKYYTVDGLLTAPPLNCCVPPNSVDIEAHYSFDFAQQVF